MSALVTIQGNLAYDPELSFTTGGKAKCRLTVISSSRRQNKQTQEWEDADVTAWRITVWDQLAENVAGTFAKGEGVIVVGKAIEERWEEKGTGAKRSAIVIRADDVAPSLKRVTAVLTRSTGAAVTRSSAPATNEDPWARTTPQAGQNDPWATATSQGAPPF